MRGIAFLLLWLLIATGGLVVFHLLGRTGTQGLSEPDFIGPQWCATMIASLLVALVAVNGAVQCRLLVARGASPRGWSDRVPSLLVAFIAPVLICVCMWLAGRSLTLIIPPADLTPDDPWLAVARRSSFVAWRWSFLSCLCAILTVRGLMVWVYPSIKSGQVLVALFVILAWAAPPLIDFAMTEAAHSRRADSYEPAPKITNTWLFGCSPAGTIIADWEQLLTREELRSGLFVQAAIAAVATIAAAASSRKVAMILPAPRPELATSG